MPASVSDSTSAPTSLPLAECAHLVRRLETAVQGLAQQAAVLGLPGLEGREWYEQLQRKLLPQLSGEPFVVAAVVGGTNIGKSVIFNHLAGVRASATSPLASGTKHPTCLVPGGFTTQHPLGEIFPGFELIPWSQAGAALDETDRHLLFWKPAPELPSNLLILDTPDIDSDAPVNWLRADRVRACADVLVAVLTQQKYNDAAVKQFFRKAAAEDKAVIVVFNQVLLPEDEQYWPKWLETFSRETGVQPDLVYIAPNDRRAAEENRLPFYERAWPVEDGRTATVATPSTPSVPRNLRDDLASLKFRDIKLRTLRGSLRQVVSTTDGAPAWLSEVRRRSAGFQDASTLLSMQQLARIDNWPSPPAALFVNQIREWWRLQREGWTKTIHDGYSRLGETVLAPLSWARQKLSGPTPDPAEAYLAQERQLMLQTIEELYAELTRLSQLGNELLRPRLEKLLSGTSRSDVLEQLSREQGNLNVTRELHEVVSQQMTRFRDESPGSFGLLKKLDTAAALARPVTSVALFAAA
ncbi:MAG: GTPase, partial [Planctomycetaceae bacterium]